MEPTTAAPMDSRAGRNLDIDRLRAVAILLVLVAHLPMLLLTTPEWHRGVRFWVGVDLFFCISGFVVAMALLPKLDAALKSPHSQDGRSGTVGDVLKAFFIRRAFRILPLSWLWLALLVLAAVGFNQTGAFGPWRATVDAVPSILTYWNNLWVYYRIHHGGVPTLALVYWSLSLEEQFYLLFPLLLVAIRLPMWRVLVLLALIAVQLPLYRPEWSLAWAVRSDAIALGVCLFMFSRASAYRRFESVVLRYRWAAIGLGAGLVVCLPVLATVLAKLPGSVGVVAIVSALLVFIASFDRDCILPIPGLKGVLDWTGTRSYGLYLAHTPIYNGTWELWFRLTNTEDAPTGPVFYGVVGAGLVMLILVTEALHRSFEAPLRNLGRRLAERYSPAAAAPGTPLFLGTR
jgi:peptidoglycan/LPS O-acetylase OafA/YrhL